MDSKILKELISYQPNFSTKNNENIKNLLIKHDPQGLIAVGCPQDEYDTEAILITQQIELCSKVEDVLNLIYSVFVVQFTLPLAGDKKQYQQLSEDIWKLKTHKE